MTEQYFTKWINVRKKKKQPHGNVYLDIIVRWHTDSVDQPHDQVIFWKQRIISYSQQCKICIVTLGVFQDQSWEGSVNLYLPFHLKYASFAKLLGPTYVK